jgi:aryl-alcohol dehydrogenase-like predicted oxidoreductase
MKQRRLGRTGLMVSEISLGTVELGLDYGIRPVGDDARPDESTASALLNHALDAGINFIDTARAYGTSEEIIGRALAGRRDEYVLASKVSSFSKENLPPQALRERVARSVEQSLHALHTSVIDIMLVHSTLGDTLDDGPVWEALSMQREAGNVRFLGASVYGEQAALDAMATGYDCLQIAYSVLDRGPEGRVLVEAAARDAGIVVRSVLLKGALTHRCRELPDAMQPLKRAVEQMSEMARGEVGSLPELAYRYVLGHPSAHTALVGTAHVAEMEAAVGYASRGALSQDLVRRIRSIEIEDPRWLNPANWPI